MIIVLLPYSKYPYKQKTVNITLILQKGSATSRVILGDSVEGRERRAARIMEPRLL